MLARLRKQIGVDPDRFMRDLNGEGRGRTHLSGRKTRGTLWASMARDLL